MNKEKLMQLSLLLESENAILEEMALQLKNGTLEAIQKVEEQAQKIKEQHKAIFNEIVASCGMTPDEAMKIMNEL